MEILFKVFTLALQIYLGGTGVIGVMITYYGLCYPGFFQDNRKILSWVMLAWIAGFLSCAGAIVIAAVFTYLI
ncbi:hypothetical protein [Priestia megaterium]|uniref:hypothetical protein n=1 Tax=Priestia megaterium TaxID=1404 RepID=UPI0012D8F55F|nr:hypothetical protein [Priestia megaterium]MUL34750.1 hypothetical protein [Priestia megaterium]